MSLYVEKVRKLKRSLIADAVRAAEGSRSEAARRLGISPAHLYRLVTDLHVTVRPNRNRGRAAMLLAHCSLCGTVGHNRRTCARQP